MRLAPPICGHPHLHNWLVPSPSIVARAVREEIIEDQTQDREEEDNQAPQNLVHWWAVALEDLDCLAVSLCSQAL